MTRHQGSWSLFELADGFRRFTVQPRCYGPLAYDHGQYYACPLGLIALMEGYVTRSPDLFALELYRQLEQHGYSPAWQAGVIHGWDACPYRSPYAVSPLREQFQQGRVFGSAARDYFKPEAAS